MTLQTSDGNGVRTITLDRPESLNAFNEALYDAATVALRAADADPEVSVVLLTGAGRAFSAGNDLNDMAARVTDPDYQPGEYGFQGLMEALIDLRKPLVCAVNGLAVGIGTTILGYADLVFMSSTARLKCPFTSLGVAPEAASSYLLPQLIGRQNAAWILMSSEWIDAGQAQRMGVAWQVCEPQELLAEARRHAEVMASRPLSSLIAVKHTIVEPTRDAVRAAIAREYAQFEQLLGSAANSEALAAFADRRNSGQ